ncbi:GNAT family N-acetyltransferase [Hymenobacter terrenus]|uniref:GNAT family N-acetyltransferase n=1 Tax=Hymenobacter terrenus TaxID=1629124 RepID=UPI0018CE9A5C|nr:GNAT family N-acetyltransferase [Hymenobacter terrenus]
MAQELSAAALTALLHQSRAAGIRLIYLIADPAAAETAVVARQAGGWLADRKMTFTQEIAALPVAHPIGLHAAQIVPVSVFTPQLECLAWQSGEFSRFRRDARFERHVFTDLYSQWLRASLAGEMARVVFASLTPEGRETGLLTLDQQGNDATIGLLAVAAEARGHGIAHQLVETAQLQARAWGCTRLQVVTQRDNEAACHFYTRCGFELSREERIYHVWL